MVIFNSYVKLPEGNVGFCHASSRRFMVDDPKDSLHGISWSLMAGAFLWLSCVEVHSNVRGSLNVSGFHMDDSSWKFILLFKARQFSDISVDILPNKCFDASWNCQIESQDSGKSWCRVYMNIYIILYNYIYIYVHLMMLNRMVMGLNCQENPSI